VVRLPGLVAAQNLEQTGVRATRGAVRAGFRYRNACPARRVSRAGKLVRNIL